jgi:hypothetical protein
MVDIKHVEKVFPGTHSTKDFMESHQPTTWTLDDFIIWAARNEPLQGIRLQWERTVERERQRDKAAKKARRARKAEKKRLALVALIDERVASGLEQA